jgi:hypothetical protein
VYPGPDSCLTLPARQPHGGDDERIAFEAPEEGVEMAYQTLRAGASRQRALHHDLVRGTTELADTLDGGRLRLLPSRLETEFVVTDTYTIADGDPLSASVRCQRWLGQGRDDFLIRVTTDSRVTADAVAFHMTDTVEAWEGDTQVFKRTWTRSVPRDHV